MKTIDEDGTEGSENKKWFSFVTKSTIAYSLCYLIIGAIAYQLITKQFYIGDDPVFTAYLRSEANPDEWSHTNTWIIQGVLLRAILISMVLLPFVETLERFSFRKRVGVLFSLTFVLIHLAAAAPSPSNIEGLIYMKDSLISTKAFLLTQPEMIAQCLLFALSLSWIIKTRHTQSNWKVAVVRPKAHKKFK